MTHLFEALSSPLAQSPLLAAGGIDIDVNATVLVQTVLFFAFMMFMKPLIFDPLLRVFEERERRTAGAVDRARGMDEKAIALKNEADQKLDATRREAGAEREANRAALAKQRSEQTESARQAASEKLDGGMKKVEAEVSQIRKDLETERKTLAAEIASRVLGREVKGA